MERSQAIRVGGMYNSGVERGEATAIRGKSGLINRLLHMSMRMERLYIKAGVKWTHGRQSRVLV